MKLREINQSQEKKKHWQQNVKFNSHFLPVIFSLINVLSTQIIFFPMSFTYFFSSIYFFFIIIYCVASIKFCTHFPWTLWRSAVAAPRLDVGVIARIVDWIKIAFDSEMRLFAVLCRGYTTVSSNTTNEQLKKWKFGGMDGYCHWCCRRAHSRNCTHYVYYKIIKHKLFMLFNNLQLYYLKEHGKKGEEECIAWTQTE